MDDKLYTVKEVAEMFSVATSTIRKKLRKGDLKGIKIGKVWRIKRTEIQRYCKEGIDKAEYEGMR